MRTIRLHRKQGFSIIELTTALVLVFIIALMITPTLQSIVFWSRIRNDVSNLELVIHKTMGQSVARGAAGRLRIENGTLIGEVQLPDATFELVDSHTPVFGAFGRNQTNETPWLNISDLDPSSFTDDTATINGMGMVVAPGGVFFLNYQGNEAAIELLPTGMVVTHFQRAGSDIWSQ